VRLTQTAAIAEFVEGSAEPLNDLTPGRFYVVVTVVRQSVGIVLGDSKLCSSPTCPSSACLEGSTGAVRTWNLPRLRAPVARPVRMRCT